MSNWNNMIDWDLVLPPSRPTVDELFRIKKYIKPLRRDVPVAILGSTPEYRELLYSMGFLEIYVFDRSLDFYNFMSSLTPCIDKKNEHLILGDWLDTLQNYKDFFQVILSDLTMGNIHYDSRDKFYSSIYNSLIKNGSFIDKVLTFDFMIPSIKDLFDKYEQLPINIQTINNFSSEVLFCSELVTKKNIVDSSHFYNLISIGNFTKKIKFLAKKSRLITPEGFVWYYGKPWDDLKKEYYKEYSSIFIYPETDINSPYFNRTKHFFNLK